ncbi:hypothetical protein SAMD00019534_105910 [Acytostelium subglobosum LB1]|uniref:hypothetical protein n=1 Tax=Acytostelium subglobosum LB1 TaxID=1410327 RepID=UPI0006448DB5|nr:hypothetical protein SAMD00019534_105910 [Acytostelium subglobosum LB1]GAM27415.1 hypothetical protein SAMD00019534_105910 [Acytostelium subglobosum LB1]|eukprot:XP_012749480.1 hypothetical protein SAMD00019534_105910 [Acytostelium subglobosum LB1]
MNSRITLLLLFVIVLLLPTTIQGKIRSKEQEENCDLCKYLVSQVERYIQDNSTTTHDQILGYLSQDCTVLGPWQDDCLAEVKLYGSGLIDNVLDSKENPQIVCSKVGACTALYGSLAEAVDPRSDCPICEWMAQVIVSDLQQNMTDDDIQANIQNQCTVFVDQDWITTCISMDQNYGLRLIQSIQQGQSCDQSCFTCGLCGTPTSISSSSGQTSGTSTSGTGSGWGTGGSTGSSGGVGTGSGST